MCVALTGRARSVGLAAARCGDGEHGRVIRGAKAGARCGTSRCMRRRAVHASVSGPRACAWDGRSLRSTLCTSIKVCSKSDASSSGCSTGSCGLRSSVPRTARFGEAWRPRSGCGDLAWSAVRLDGLDAGCGEALASARRDTGVRVCVHAVEVETVRRPAIVVRGCEP